MAATDTYGASPGRIPVAASVRDPDEQLPAAQGDLGADAPVGEAGEGELRAGCPETGESLGVHRALAILRGHVDHPLRDQVGAQQAAEAHLRCLSLDTSSELRAEGEG
jgi:hypothetical protein